MKRFLIIGAVAAMFALGACATSQATEGQSLSAAQTAVAAGLQGVHQAYVTGVISKAQVQKADVLADQADTASIAARAAYASGDSTTALGAIAQMTTLATEIVALEKPQ